MTDMATLDPVVLHKEIADLGIRINGLEEKRQELITQLSVAGNQRDQAKSDAASARGQLAPLKAEVERLKKVVAQSEDLKEMGRLRREVSALHIQLADANKRIDHYGESLLRAEHARIAAEGRFKALEGTAALMQRSRDAAIQREGVSVQLAREAKTTVEETLGRLAEVGKAVDRAQATITTVTEIHRKGHPEPVEGCRLCYVLGGGKE